MKYPTPSEEDFYVGLLTATFWFDDAFQLNLEAMGFARTTRMESFVIVNIAAGEQKAIDIAKRLGISRQAVSKILKDFEARGWITVREDPDDRRAQIVSFSDAFAPRAEICAKIIHGIVRELEERIGRKLVNTMRKALARNWREPPTLEELRSIATPHISDRPQTRSKMGHVEHSLDYADEDAPQA